MPKLYKSCSVKGFIKGVKIFTVLFFATLLSVRAVANVYVPNVFTDPVFTSINNATGAIILPAGNAGQISLRSALTAADNLGGTHTITLSTGTYNLTQALPNREITFGNTSQNITINGNGPANTIINMVNDANKDRIFFINPVGTTNNVITNVSGIKFQNGYLSSDIYGGAGICAGGGTGNALTVTNCTFDNNFLPVNDFGGAAVCMQVSGNLTIDNSTFTNNVSNDADGGAVFFIIFNNPGYQGNLLVTNSTFTGNSVNVPGATNSNGGALAFTGQGGIVGSFSVNIHNNTFTNNTADGYGGAISANNSPNLSTSLVNFNRFVGNTSSTSATTSGMLFVNSAGSVNADNNWWGCNTGPTAAGACDKAAGIGAPAGGSLIMTKWLQLKTTASPTPICNTAAGLGNTTTVTTSFLTNSASEAVTVANISRLIGLPVTWGPTTLGSLSAQQASIQASGTATATFTSNGTGGNATVNTEVDNVPASDVIAQATISVHTKPTVTNPSNFTSCVSGIATFSSTITGNLAPTITWKKGGVALVNGVQGSGSTVSGQGTATLTITNVQPGDAAVDYTVEASNECGTTISANITLSVNQVTAGTVGSDQTICSAGDPALFTESVASTGSGALTYQWQSGTTSCAAGFSNIGGATATTYDPPAGLLVTTYYRRVTTSTLNAVPCTANSNCITVTVNNVTGGTIAADQTICSAGDPALFTQTVASSGSGALTYQWQSSTTSCAAGFSDIGGATATTYDPPAGLLVTTFYHRVTTSTLNAVACTANSNCITVSVNDVTGGTVGSDQTVCSGGDPAAFTQSVASTGSGALTYQWQSSTTSCAAGFSNIGGATAATYDAPAGLLVTTFYRRVTTSTLNAVACTANSNCITVSINNVTGGTVGSDQTTCSGGDPAAFTESAVSTGSGALTYQWQSSTTSCAAGFSDIGGATTTTYDPPAGLLVTTFYHRVTTSTLNAVACTANSNCITVAVNNVTGGTVGSDQAFCVSGDPVLFTQTIASTGSGALTYQWQSSTTSCAAGFSNIGGATSSTYDAPAGLAVTTYYRRVTTSTLAGVPCTANSNCITVTINPNNTVTLTSAPGTDAQSVLINTPITNITYATTGATGATFSGLPPGVTGVWAANVVTISGTPTSAAGSPYNYTVTLTGGCGVITANGSITVTVCSITLTSAAGTNAQSVCVNAPITNITYATTGATGATFSGLPPGVTGAWAANVVTISGSPTATGTFSYTITPTGGGCSGAVTATGTITSSPIPNAIATPSSQTVCSAVPITTIALTGGVPGTVFNWTRDNNVTVTGIAASGAGDISGTLTNTTAAAITVTFTITPTVNSCPGTAITATVLVNPTPNAVAIPVAQSICSGSAIATIVLSGNVPGTVFNWTRDNNVSVTGIAASGAGDINGSLTNTTNAAVTVTFTITPTANGCLGTPITATVLVEPIPDVTQPANQVVCNNNLTAPVNFTGAVAGTSFNWTNTAPSIGLSASGTGNIASFNAINAGNVPVVATITVTPVAPGPITQTFNFTGAMQTFTVPAGVTSITIDAYGAQGGNGAAGTISPGGNGGNGSKSSGTLTVAPGQVLNIFVGGNGTTPAGGFNGGGAGGTANAGGGGGASDVRYPGITTADRLIVGGGGGGGGRAGCQTSAIGGNGGSGGGNGTNGQDAATSGGFAGGGAGAIGPNGGAKGIGCAGFSGVNGSTAVNENGAAGGSGQICCCPSQPGGGGGGGGFLGGGGGGGGSAGTTACSGNDKGGGGGGAGGSNYTGGVTGGSNVNGVQTGNGLVTITYTPAGAICTGTPKTFTITVNPTPNAVATPSSQTICSGSAITTIVSSGNVAGTVFNWTRDNNVAVTGIAASGAGNISGSLTNTTAASVTVTFTITPIANGCPGAPITATVLVIPTPTVNAIANQTVCNGSPTTAVNFSGTPAGTLFSWSNSDPSIGLATSGNGNIASFTATNATNAPVTATVTVTPLSPGSDIAYITNYINNTLTVFDINANAIIATIPTGGNPNGIALSPDGTKVYTANLTTNDVTVINTATNTVITTIPLGPGTGPRGICVSPDGTRVYTGNTNSGNSVSVIDAATNTVITTIPLVGGTGPVGVVVSPDGSRLYTANSTSSNVSVINTATNTFITNVPAGGTSTFGIAITPDGSKVYATNLATQNMVVINTATNTVLTNINGLGANPCGVSVSPDGSKVYEASQSGNINVISTATNTIIATFSSGDSNPTGTSINATGTMAYAANQSAGRSLSKINTITNLVTNSAAAGASPFALGNFIKTVNPSCPGTPKTFTITVNPTPNAVATPSSQTTCSGQTITTIALTGNVVGTVFNWTRNNTGTVTGIAASGSGNISGALTNITASPITVTFTITPSYTNGGTTCLGTPITATVLVNPTPDATATPSSQTKCSGIPITTIVLTGTVPGTIFNWVRDNNVAVTGIAASGAGDISGTLTNTTNAPVTVTFTITPTAFGCTPGTPVTATVLVNPTPVATVPANTGYCNGTLVPTGSLNFTSNVAGTTFTWTNGNIAIGLGASGSGNTLPTFTATNGTNAPISGTITVTPTANGCPGALQTFIITVNPTPNAVATPSAQTICSATAITTIALTGNVAGTVFNWTRNNTIAVTGIAASGAGNISGTLTNTTNAPVTVTFTITPSFTNAGVTCTGTPITATVLVNPTPSAVAAPSSQTVCSGNPITTIVLSGNVAGTTFNWTRDNNAIVSGIAASGSGNISGTLNNLTFAPVTVTFTITPIANGCPGPSITATVLVNPTPDATATPTSQTICSASAITTIVLTSNVAGTTFNWTRNNTVSVTGIAASGSGNISGILTNTTNAPVMVVFTITPTANGCVGLPIPATVLVNPTPNAVATPASQTICSFTAITTIVLTGNVAGTTFNWTRNNTVAVIGMGASGTGNISGSLTNTTNIPQTVTFTITPTANGCPGPSITATVLVNPTPNAVATPASQTICSGSAITTIVLTGNVSGTTFNWTRDNTVAVTGIAASGTGNISGTLTNTTNIPQTVTFTITPIANGCPGAPITATVLVNPTPSAVATPASQTICSASAITTIVLTGAVSGTTYSWTRDNNVNVTGIAANGAGNISGTLTNTTNIPQTVTFTITPTANGCPGPSITATVLVNPTPNAVATPASQTICSNNPITTIVLTGNVTGTTFNWTRDNTVAVTGISASGTGNISGTLTNTTSVPVTVTFTITPTANGCPGPSITATVLVNPTPNAVATPASQTICSANAITTIVLSGAVTGTTFNWTRDNNVNVTGIAASGAGNISGTLTNTTNIPQTVTFTITPTANGCAGPSITATVIVNPTPNAVATPASQTICSAGAITTIVLTGNVAGTTFNWTRDNNVNVTGIASSGAGSISGTLTNTTNVPQTVTFTITPIANGCPGPSITATVLVNPTPNAVATPASQTICSANPITTIVLTGAVTGTTFNWTRDNNVNVTGIAASGAGNISGTLTNTTNVPQTVTFTITPIANGCPGVPTTASVLVNPTPNAVAAPASQTICSASAITTIVLTGNVAGTTFNWTRDNNATVTGIPGGGSGNISGTLTNTTSAPVTVTFTITPTANGCPGPSITATVLVNPTPNAVATPASQTICSANAITTIVLSGAVTGTTFNWTRDNTVAVTGIAASGIGNISGTLTNTTSAPVTVTFTITPTASGCPGPSITATVLVNPTPNAVATPASQTICSAGAIATIVLTGNVAGTVFNWTRDNTTTVAGIPGFGSGNISGTLTNNTTGQLTVTFTITPIANGCPGAPITATVIVNPKPTIVCPANIIVNAVAGTCGSDVNYPAAIATGTPAPVVTYSIPSGSNFPVGVTTVTVTATNICGTATCTFTITVLDVRVPVITTQPASQAVCIGNSATFSVVATNAASYQWQTGNAINQWGNIAGATSASYTVNNTTMFFNGVLYRVAITGPCGTVVFSNPVTLTVNPLPLITLSSATTPQLQPNRKVTIVATASPSGGTYAWLFNGAAITGATGPTLGPLTVDNIGRYNVVYTDPNGCVNTSSDFLVTGEQSDYLWIYPNPNTGHFQVRFYNHLNEQYTLEIYNPLGQKIYTQALQTGGTTYWKIDVNLGGTSAGIYTVKLVDKNGMTIAAKRMEIFHP